MRIATFNSLEEAQGKLDTYNNLAKHISSPVNFSLTPIIKHSTDNVWWFDFDACIENGGLGRVQIENDVGNVNIVHVEDLYALGYLPTSDDM